MAASPMSGDPDREAFFPNAPVRVTRGPLTGVTGTFVEKRWQREALVIVSRGVYVQLPQEWLALRPRPGGGKESPGPTA
jgi:hypothetical protein